MIVGIISLTQAPIDMAVHQLKEQWNFTIISENDLISSLGVGNLVNNSNLKYSILSELENHYENLLVYGNVLLDKTVCQCISNHNGKIVVAFEANPAQDSSLKGHYAEQVDMQELATVFQNKWYKDPMKEVIYWDFDSSDTLPFIDMVFIESVQGKKGSDKNLDSIINEKLSKPVDTQSIEVKQENNISIEVYMKIKDGRMVLLLPQSSLLSLPVKELEGEPYTALVFKAPDLGDTYLQKLKIINGD